jgi:glycosyltransferase involved in cell wall biosynthesis
MNYQNKKLIFLVTELGYFCSHRLNLALAAKRAGFNVWVVTNCGQRPHLSRYEAQLKELEFHHIAFHRSRLNPYSELKTLLQIWKIYRQIRPDIVHQVALKPVIYGTLCGLLTRIPRIVNALGGMGYLFTHRGLKSFLIRPLLAFSFWMLLNNRRCALILQNPDDVELMTSFIDYDKVHLIRGAGVDLERFRPTQEPPSPPLKALMVSRLLWSKGIGELVEAARVLKDQGVPLQIQVAGDIDPQNPASVPYAVLAAWKEEKVITWLGAIENIPALYATSHIAVLPSYREGLPKSLLEAAAFGKPIVTTDVPGCREVVTQHDNGFLVPAKNAIALAEALKELVESLELRIKMGQSSREKAQQEFDEKKIVAETLRVYL